MKSPLLRTLLGIAILVALAIFVLMPGSTPTTTPTAGLLGTAADVRERYVAEPGEAPGEESEDLLAMGDFFYHRVSYPTGNFESRWVVDAAAQDQAIERGVPAGEVTYNPTESQSPLALSPNRFTSLGPLPLQSNGCISCYSYGLVSGRVNTIVIDPVTPNVAYLGADGGGVWKTTNCCTAATTWPAVSFLLVFIGGIRSASSIA